MCQVAQVNAYARQNQTQAQQRGNHAQHHQWRCQCCDAKHPWCQQRTQNQHRQAQRSVKQSAQNIDPHQTFEWKDHPFYQIGLLRDKPGCTAYHLREKVKYHQTGKNVQGKQHGRVFSARPLGLENHPKHHGVDGQQQQRIHKSPANAQYRSLVLSQHIALGELPY